MKKLMKISLCLVMALFVTNSVSASGPVTDQDATGTVSLHVAKYLCVTVDPGDADFTFNLCQGCPTQDLAQKSVTATVTASCNWEFYIKAQAPNLVDGMKLISIGYFNYGFTTSASTVIAQPLTNVVPPLTAIGTGVQNETINVVWNVDGAGLTLLNPFEGNYAVNVDYIVVELP